MIHQPSGGAQVLAFNLKKIFILVNALLFIFQGQATDIQIQADEIQKLKKQLTNIYVKHTKQSFDLLYNKMERDLFLNPEEAKELGIVDSVLEHPPSASPENDAK